MSFVGSIAEASSAPSSAACNIQLADAQMAAQTVFHVLDLCNNEPVAMVMKSTNPPVTERHADNLPVSGEDVESLDDENCLHLTHSYVLKMIYSAIIRFE